MCIKPHFSLNLRIFKAHWGSSKKGCLFFQKFVLSLPTHSKLITSIWAGTLLLIFFWSSFIFHPTLTDSCPSLRISGLTKDGRQQTQREVGPKSGRLSSTHLFHFVWHRLRPKPKKTSGDLPRRQDDAHGVRISRWSTRPAQNDLREFCR